MHFSGKTWVCPQNRVERNKQRFWQKWGNLVSPEIMTCTFSVCRTQRNVVWIVVEVVDERGLLCWLWVGNACVKRKYDDWVVVVGCPVKKRILWNIVEKNCQHTTFSPLEWGALSVLLWTRLLLWVLITTVVTVVRMITPAMVSLLFRQITNVFVYSYLQLLLQWWMMMVTTNTGLFPNR